MSNITIVGILAIITVCNAVIPLPPAKIPNAISFYKDVNRQGTQVYLTQLQMGKCYTSADLGRTLNDNISQVDTFGNCLLLFKKDYCFGTPIRIGDRTNCAANLTGCGFNDKLSSFKMVPCKRFKDQDNKEY